MNTAAWCASCSDCDCGSCAVVRHCRGGVLEPLDWISSVSTRKARRRRPGPLQTSKEVFRQGVVHGLVAGAVGVTAMTISEKLEQRLTGRPDSHVPGATMAALLGMAREPAGMNLLMHVGQGVFLGALRGAMAHAGLRGPFASVMFAVVRLTNDQTLENATGIGAPPWTWPRDELAVDLIHKSVYAVTTGFVADRLADRRGPGPGQRHAQRVPGRHADVGPPPN